MAWRYSRDRFAAAADVRRASEKELLMAGRYMSDDPMRIVLEYTRIDPGGMYNFLDHVDNHHRIDDMTVNIVDSDYRFPLGWSVNKAIIKFNLDYHHGQVSFYIDREDLFTYIECGDIPRESDAMRVIRETFGRLDADYVLSCHNGLHILRSFFDYCIWPINKPYAVQSHPLNAPIKIHNPFAWSESEDDDASDAADCNLSDSDLD